MGPGSGDAPAGRVPPYSEEAERGVLGAALLDAERVIDLAIQRQIRPESFYFKQHRLLFEVVRTMHGKNMAIDLLTVHERLRAHEQLEDVGGLTYLQNLIDSTPTTAHAEHYMQIVFDRALLRSVIQASTETIDHCYDPDKESMQVLADAQENLFALGENRAETLHSWSDIIEKTVEHVNLLADNKIGSAGVPTGYKDLDKMLRGFQPSDMIVLAARPSMGKTSLALNIAEQMALGNGNRNNEPSPVAVFSLEMSAEQLVRRMLCCNAQVPFHALSGGSYLAAEHHQKLLEAATKLRDLPLYIDDAAGLDIMDLRARARRMHRKFGIKAIVVDYLQLMHCDRVKDNRQHEVAVISGGIKAMAKELNVPVLILSQLSRAAENRDRSAKPRLSDLRESGSIEQDADVVMLLRRPVKYPDDPESADTTLAIVDIAKHRNGSTGDIRMNFIDKYTLFQDRVEDRADDYDAMVEHNEGPDEHQADMQI